MVEEDKVESVYKVVATLTPCTSQFFERNSCKLYNGDPESGDQYWFLPFVLKKTDKEGVYEMIELYKAPKEFLAFIKSKME